MNHTLEPLYSIHQPNFLPWLGFFDKINKTDKFIFFDHVQRPRGKSWLSRVKVNCFGNEKWLSIPIKKSGHSIERICEAQINNPKESFNEIHSKILNYYRKAKYINEFENFFIELEPEDEVSLSEFNISFIVSVSKELGFNTEFFRSSQKDRLMNSESVQTDMIIETCQEFGIVNYLSGTGASFLELDQFKEAGIQLSFQEFDHPVYNQIESAQFISGLSIVDALVNLGFDGTRELYT